MDSGKPVRVRYAPSPTGYLHIGGLRTALYNYLFAKHHKGTFVLRIEDTDRTRYVEGATENLIRSLVRCGVTPDEGPLLNADGGVHEVGKHGPYVQSQRLSLYADHAHRLVAMGAAYYCVCTAERLEDMRQRQIAAKQPTMYDKHCRMLGLTKESIEGKPYVVRLAVPADRVVTFHDLIRGSVSFHTNQIDDQVLLKSDGFPTYHLAVVVDDHAMEISHIIRGEEWLPSTPKHVLLYEAFGWSAPEFAHLPLLLNSDRSKLSKRQGDVAVEDYLKKGYVPEALVNFVALLGWNPTGDRELYTMSELIDGFDITKVNMSGAVVNFEKLDWVNGNYIRSMQPEECIRAALPYLIEAGLVVERREIADGHSTSKLYAVAGGGVLKRELDPAWLAHVIGIERDRLSRFSDVAHGVAFFFTLGEYPREMLAWKEMSLSEVGERLVFLVQLLEGLPLEHWKATELERHIKDAVTARGFRMGEVLWPMRVALSGRQASPPPFDIAAILGKEETIRRINNAISRISHNR